MITPPALSSSYSPSVARPGNFHLTAFLADAAERYPLRTLTVDGMELTYEKAWVHILKIATWLQQNGVNRGDKVVAVLRNSPDLHLITLAVAHIGGVMSVLSPQLRAEGFKQILDECEPVCIFLEKTTRHLKVAAENILTVWMDAGINTGGWEEADFSEVMATKPAWGMRFPGTSDDPAFLVYSDTNSNSSTSRGVLISHNRVRNALEQNHGGLRSDVLSIFQCANSSSMESAEAVMVLPSDH